MADNNAKGYKIAMWCLR